MGDNNIKDFYSGYSDKIFKKRFNSPYLLRRYVHLKQYEAFLRHIKPGMRVLDAGCGEGVLSIMMAQKGAMVVGCDLSVPNIENARQYAQSEGLSNIEFMVADLEKIPFADDSFDLVVSSHVLEHLPDFNQGLREIMRVTKKTAVVAIPTVFNLCSLVQVGRGWFYLKGLRSFLAIFWGFIKMLWALVSGQEGVNESYGREDIPHIFRFPWIMKNKIKKENFKLTEYEASSICLPYFFSLLPVIKFLDKNKTRQIMRNLGYGTTYLIDK
ncbi:MAG: class I SAM-dependent methyltransferase [Candidatus Paceibacterota bacterium]|jgi:2-polyprenyl-3-methyl-5-hydroxy-6-metoxy-1,4-benzoquinol methylase